MRPSIHRPALLACVFGAVCLLAACNGTFTPPPGGYYIPPPPPVQPNFYPVVSQPPQPQRPALVGPQAYWTGKSSMGQSITGAPIMVCEYSYAGRLFTRGFAVSCPSSVTVE